MRTFPWRRASSRGCVSWFAMRVESLPNDAGHRSPRFAGWRMRVWTASFCIVAAALACRTPSVDAPGPPYDPTTSTDGRIYHWPLGAPISVHVVAGPAASGDTLLASTTIALARWAGTLAYR